MFRLMGGPCMLNDAGEQIETNKDLDLPTQQILVAQFKCDEIVESVFQEFLTKYQHHFKEVDAAPDFEELGALFADLRQDAFEDYDASASRYNKAVYEQRGKIEMVDQRQAQGGV